ncbi:hypothetical protein [Lentilactobacillus fungorum]|nr:hypothetical protein [Lentilactobacillus fungorum]
MIWIRRHLHEYPELSFKEKQTTQSIEKCLLIAPKLLGQLSSIIY